jgi:hypothetical protein
MPPTGAIDRMPDHGAAAYRRAARRIRHIHARQPGRLYRELCGLAERHGASSARVMEPPATYPGRPEAFAAEVVRRMDGPVLRQAQRRELMRVARREGIGRFEANLVIAAVQHRRGQGQPVEASAHAAGRGGAVGAVALVLGIQGIIAWGVWAILSG